MYRSSAGRLRLGLLYGEKASGPDPTGQSSNSCKSDSVVEIKKIARVHAIKSSTLFSGAEYSGDAESRANRSVAAENTESVIDDPCLRQFLTRLQRHVGKFRLAENGGDTHWSLLPIAP